MNFAKFLRTPFFYRIHPVAFLILENKHLFYRTRPVAFSTLENKKQFLNQNQIRTITNSFNETPFLLSVAFAHHFLSPKKVNNRTPHNVRKNLQLVAKTPERLHRRQSGVFIANPNVTPNLAPAPPLPTSMKQLVTRQKPVQSE